MLSLFCVVLVVFVGCDGIGGGSRGGRGVCVSGESILFWSDAGLRLCELFLGEAVVCCVDGLDCGGGGQWGGVGCGGIEGTCIRRDEDWRGDEIVCVIWRCCGGGRGAFIIVS